jgi:predicted nucleotidyltransferase
MVETIKSELENLELKYQVKILLAVESGSRAWGFASKDSDWDVRFIYIHKPDWYLSIDDKKDNIEEMLPGNLDFAGWELRKALKLFRKSNPPLLEWLRSPLKYQEQYDTAQSMRALAARYFNPKSCVYHYLSMAKGNFYNYLQQQTVRTKKYFYALRPIFACK